MPTYYNTPDPILRESSVTCLDRIKIELNSKPYYADDMLKIYLDENGLDPYEIYSKDTDYKKLLQAVCDVLEAVSNDPDQMRSIQTEFSTTSEAAKYMERRIALLQKKVNALTDSSDDGKQKSIFTHMFRTN